MSYVMPEASLGECVWFFRPGEEGVPAIITKIGARSIQCSLHGEDNRGHIVKNGARHVSDPEAFRLVEHEDGYWDYTDWQKRLIALERITKDLA
jgi:hypothetical protein